MEIIRHYQTENPCYKAGRRIKPSGIVVHSTGANNPYIKRYVGPDDGILGVNKYGNHWNKPEANKCMHAWIGKVADGSLKVYQTLPWDYRCWGVASGKNGSYNATHIQFEICEDDLTDEAYYKAAFDLAIEFCAYLCKLYSIPVENIVGHYEAYKAGYGSNHGDPRTWQKKHGGSMAQFRADVKALINGDITPTEPAEKVPDQVVEEKKETAEKPKETPTQATQTESGVVTMKTLRKGSQGTQVKVLQWLLNENGFDAGKVDGIFGANTQKAVKAYQTAHKLSADGVVGKNTWNSILA